MRPSPMRAILTATAFLWAWQALAAECLMVKYRDTPVCLDSFTCSDTPQSSFVRRVCYDAAKAYMLIQLKVTWYHYCAIDQTTVSALLSAPSVGSYYNKNIRAGRFDCREHPVPAY